MARAKPTKQKTTNVANVGYEAELWQMANALRGNMDAILANSAINISKWSGEPQCNHKKICHSCVIPLAQVLENNL